MASRNRGRKKPRLRDLSRSELTSEEVTELYDEFSGPQNPLVTAILGQALLENELDGLLRSHFVRRDDKTWATLTDDRGPLATFHNKIVAAHAFGICDDVIRDGLNTIRQIRNAFAHSKKRLKFSHELIVRSLTTITLPDEKRKRLYKSLSDIREIAASAPENAQSAYVMLCTILDTELIKKKATRLQARYSRLTKKHRKALVKALMGDQPKPSGRGLLSSLESRSAGQSSLAHAPSPKKSSR